MRGVKPGLTGLAQVSLGYTGSPLPGSDIESLTSALTPLSSGRRRGRQWQMTCASRRMFDFAYGAAVENSFPTCGTETSTSCVPRWPCSGEPGVERGLRSWPPVP